VNIHLKNKQILITGGTSALGRAFVGRATEEGATVYFTFHTDAEVAKTLESLGAQGFQVDLSKRADMNEFRKKIKEKTRHLDALIHNAAVIRDHTIQNLTEQEWDDVLNVDLDSVYFLTKRLLSLLFKSPQASILTIVSRIGLRGGFGEANYAAAKAGLMALTKSLAKELGRKKIRVNALNPGFMKSKMTTTMPQEAFERNVNESVFKEISNPEAVSNFMIYLLSDHFSSVSGQVFHFDSRPV
jgi:3-oxoacyl-[acyl-carrier protein] reductase